MSPYPENNTYEKNDMPLRNVSVSLTINSAGFGRFITVVVFP